MVTVVLVLHIIASITLIASVLFQTGRGESLSSMFGGGGSDMFFGATGTSKFLATVTTVAAIVFMVTSIGLAKLKWSSPYKSVIEKTGESQAEPGQGETQSPDEQPVPGELPDLEQPPVASEPVEEAIPETGTGELRLQFPGEDETIPDSGQ